MRKLFLTICLAGLALFASSPAAAAPVDNSNSTQKPPCDADAGSLKVPAPMPNEDDSVVRPPDAPTDGLPHPGKADPGLPRPVHPPQP